MRIAVLSDIHGNHIALAEVLRNAKIEKAERLLILGDVCGYYYHPDKVMAMIEDWDYDFIQGNHERLLGQILSGEVKEKDVRKKYGSGHRFALEKLSHVQIKMILESPDKKLLNFGTTSILMCHGSPLDGDQYLYPDTDKKILDQCTVEDIDFVFVGHSHYPFVHFGKKSTLINVGSVGQSRLIGGVASWLMFDTTNSTFEMKSTIFSTLDIEREVRRIDPEVHYLRDILNRNRK